MRLIRALSVVGAAAALSGCAPGTGGGPAEAPPGRETVPLQVELVTDSWRLAADREDGTCEWSEPTYVLRDGAGEVIDAGDVPGAPSAQDGQEAAVGEVDQSGGEYSCVLVTTIDAPVAEVYDIEVTAVALPGRMDNADDGEEYSGSAMVARARADEPLTVRIEGPPRYY